MHQQVSLKRNYPDAAAGGEILMPLVLSKAFRGELVPQDPNDEPAGELLERARLSPGNGKELARSPSTSTRRGSTRRAKTEGGRQLSRLVGIAD
jgi:type I restriction enzyme S subunit